MQCNGISPLNQSSLTSTVLALSLSLVLSVGVAERETPLEYLTLVREGAQKELLARQLADMLRRNVPLRYLNVYPFPGGVDSCKLIFQSVPHATSRHLLKLRITNCSADTLNGAVASPLLQWLQVCSETPFPAEAARSSKQLITNRTLPSSRQTCWRRTALPLSASLLGLLLLDRPR
jgi:hypothetical protein